MAWWDYIQNRNQGLESNRPVGIDAPMNYQDQIRNIPNATWRGYTDRIMDDDLMVNQERREALEDIDTNPLYDDTGVYTKEPGESLFAENWTPSDLLNPFRKGDENIFGYQKRPGEGLNLTGILNTLTGRKGATESFGGYPGGFGSRAGLFPQEVANLQAVADAGYLGDRGQDVFGTNVVSQFGDYNEAMAKNLGVFEETMADKGMEDLNELEKYYLDRFGENSYIYNKLRHVRGFPGQDQTRDEVITDIVKAGDVTTGGPTITPGESERARQGGYNPSARSFRSAPGGLSQAQSRAARGDPTGTGGGWKWAQGGRVGYRNGEFVDEDVNIQGPGFDVNENIEMTSGGGEEDILEKLIAKYIEAGFPPEQAQAMAMQELQQMVAQSGQGEGIASLV